MPPFLRSLPARLGLAVAAVLLLAVGFAPLFGGPGYESALAAGIVLPFAVATATALELAGKDVEPFDAFCRGVANGAAFAATAYLITMIHGLRAGFCDAAGGSLHFALGPAIGSLLGGGWGAFAGELAGRRHRRWTARLTGVLVAIAAPLASMLFSVGRFYSSPMIFAYDPFVGYFGGTLYDTVIDFSGLFTYRAGSLATLLAAFIAALHLAHDDKGQLTFHSIGRPGLLVAGAGALVLSVASTALGPRLGHWQTAGTISAELGAVVTSERCDVVYPRAMRLADAQRFARECDAHVRAGERWMETTGPDKITAYLFADASQKGALMGAADTYIAKPWRREVYLQQGGYPHPVLGHEIAHVLAGSFGRGPFKVAGRLGGWLPNPGLIEGLAVAASPREGDLGPRDWAKAMKDLGLLPPLSRLFAFGFFGENSSLAYTVSGAFVGWIHDRYGASAVRAWYGGRDLPEVTGASWTELEKLWHEDLDRVVLPEAARAQAKAKFDRPGVFSRRCPHVVDSCKRRGDQLRSAGDEEGARAQYDKVLALDPGDAATRVTMALSMMRVGKVDQANEALRAIAADESVPRHVRDRALEELGDAALAAGEGDAAIDRYEEVMRRTVDEDQLRTLEVKIAAARDPRARPAIVALLIGDRGRPPDKVKAAELLGVWGQAAQDDGLPEYLLGRHYYGAGLFDESADRLDRALARRLAIPRVQREAERLRLAVACAVGDVDAAQRLLGVYVSHPEVPAARRDAAVELVERCGGRAPPPAPLAPPPDGGPPAASGTTTSRDAGAGRAPAAASSKGRR